MPITSAGGAGGGFGTYTRTLTCANAVCGSTTRPARTMAARVTLNPNRIFMASLPSIRRLWAAPVDRDRSENSSQRFAVYVNAGRDNPDAARGNIRARRGGGAGPRGHEDHRKRGAAMNPARRLGILLPVTIVLPLLAAPVRQSPAPRSSSDRLDLSRAQVVDLMLTFDV